MVDYFIIKKYNYSIESVAIWLSSHDDGIAIEPTPK